MCGSLTSSLAVCRVDSSFDTVSWNGRVPGDVTWEKRRPINQVTVCIKSDGGQYQQSNGQMNDQSKCDRWLTKQKTTTPGLGHLRKFGPIDPASVQLNSTTMNLKILPHFTVLGTSCHFIHHCLYLAGPCVVNPYTLLTLLSRCT